MRKTGRLFCGFLLAGMVSAGIARAETISYADAVTTLAKDCGADIKKLCKGVNLGSGRVADCLKQNAAKVSPTCTASLSNVTTSIQQREDAQTAYEKVCAHDMAQHCRGIKGDGYILACLIKTQRLVGNKCNQAITDAGWR
ncbi:cysteine rich repeat-containing protein [Rhizobium sp. A37_96]